MLPEYGAGFWGSKRAQRSRLSKYRRSTALEERISGKDEAGTNTTIYSSILVLIT